jgi:hypothetical protein
MLLFATSSCFFFFFFSIDVTRHKWMLCFQYLYRRLLLGYKTFLYQEKEKRHSILLKKVSCGGLHFYLQHNWVIRLIQYWTHTTTLSSCLIWLKYFSFAVLCGNSKKDGTKAVCIGITIKDAVPSNCRPAS